MDLNIFLTGNNPTVVLNPGPLSQAQTLDTSTINQVHITASDDISQAQNLDSIDLNPDFLLLESTSTASDKLLLESSGALNLES